MTALGITGLVFLARAFRGPWPLLSGLVVWPAAALAVLFGLGSPLFWMLVCAAWCVCALLAVLDASLKAGGML